MLMTSVLVGAGLHAQQPDGGVSTVAQPASAGPLPEAGWARQTFERYSPRVVKVQVLERESVAKSIIGSGFFVSDAGHLVTNYHVIAKRVQEPEHYRAEVLTTAGESLPAEVLALDVIHDLAVLKVGRTPAGHFMLGEGEVAQGTRLYSLGHPHDLGLTIVEGTFNGYLQHSLYRRIHFTGSINPGMSGGPAITADGRVVGVNVATAGEQVAFLVPLEHVLSLHARTTAPGYQPPRDFQADIRDQLLRHQDRYFGELLAEPGPTVRMGSWELPSELAPYFRCWGRFDADDEALHTLKVHECATDDSVYILHGVRSGAIQFSHYLLSSERLNRFRFYSLFSNFFSRSDVPPGNREHFTEFQCNTANVEQSGRPLRSVLCLRAYKKYGGLYDAIFKVATLGEPHSGLESSLTLTGISFDNARRVARRYLEAIRWRP
ncbi:MAG: serine protease [Myxococcales bacterium]